tara:strand:- start:57 stop:668 length:612 start_codon:yes stop_codon:yes gene_type:complete
MTAQRPYEPLALFDPDEALDAAVTVFWRHGFAGASMDILLDEMAISSSNLYVVFGGKYELYLRSLERYSTNVRDATLDDLEARLPPLDVLKHLFSLFIERAASDSWPRGCLLVNAAAEASGHHAETNALIVRSQTATLTRFERLLRRAQEDGDLNPVIDARGRAAALLASFHGVLILARTRSESKFLHGIADHALTDLQASLH